MTSGTPTVGTGVSATVVSGATLQLAGNVSALSSASNSASVSNSGTLNVTGTGQTVGAVTSSGTTSNNATVYSGNVVVGDGSDPASLTASQILQSSLTINANATVTILPSAGTVMAATPAASGISAPTAATSADNGASGVSDSAGGDPFTAIQAAIAAGEISSTTGQVLENRVAAIERLAATDPGLNVSLLEDRVLAVIPRAPVLQVESSPPSISGASLLALDSSSLPNGSASVAGSAAFAPAVSFAGAPRPFPSHRRCSWPDWPGWACCWPSAAAPGRASVPPESAYQFSRLNWSLEK